MQIVKCQSWGGTYITWEKGVKGDIFSRICNSIAIYCEDFPGEMGQRLDAEDLFLVSQIGHGFPSKNLQHEEFLSLAVSWKRICGWVERRE